ncbi:MAG: oligosaccharide flippase family protein [Erythrobacter sp.]|nr:oligosaccharide flippase family protein [Erythrobacter sp.]NCQ22400.1 oligosaccharide flippase family protein [Sphingomonadales bacterium]
MEFQKIIRSLSKDLFSRNSKDEGGDRWGRARHRQIARATLVGIVSRVASILTVIVTTPLAYEYLGEDRFGLWATITSIVAFLSFADLGIGNGLMSSIATAHGANDKDRVRALVSSGYAMLSLVAGSILLLLWAAYPFVDWATLFNVETELAASEAGPATATFLVLFLLNIPAMMIQRIQLGLQQSHIYSAWQIVTGLIAIAGTYLAVTFECGLPVLVLALSGPPLLVNLSNTIVSFWKRHRDIRPTIQSISVSLSKQMMALGWFFLILQSAGMFNNQIDKFLIAQEFGVDAVAPYAVVERLFNLIITVVAVLLVPLWPAFTEALERGDLAWIDSAFKNTFLICLVFTVPTAAALIFATPFILTLWIPSAPTPEFLLLCGFAAWKIVESMTSIVITYMNGMKILKFQLVLMLLTVALITPMKFLLIRTAGVAGAPWSMAVGMTVCILVPFFIFRRKLDAVTLPGRKDAGLKREPANDAVGLG